MTINFQDTVFDGALAKLKFVNLDLYKYLYTGKLAHVCILQMLNYVLVEFKKDHSK